MKLLFFLLLSFNFFTSPANAKPTEVVFYCDDDYQPYSYEDQGQAAGIYTEIIKEAAKELKDYKLTIVPLPWNRAMSALETKSVFAAYPPYYRPKERPFIGEYSVPILEETIVLYTRKELLDETKKKWPEDWYGKEVGIFLGTMDIAGPKFAKAVAEKKIKVIEEKGHEKNLLLLGHGRLDGYVNDRNSILYSLMNLKRKHKWPKSASELVEALEISKEHGYVAFSQDDPKYPYKKDFIKKFNAAILKMQKNHKISKIVNNFLKID